MSADSDDYTVSDPEDSVYSATTRSTAEDFANFAMKFRITVDIEFVKRDLRYQSYYSLRPDRDLTADQCEALRDAFHFSHEYEEVTKRAHYLERKMKHLEGRIAPAEVKS